MQQTAPTTQQLAAQELLNRRQARQNFASWCRLLGFTLMKHHEFIVNKLQEVADSDLPRYVIILLPPGTAKSTYSSMLFPPWFIARRPGYSILACSHSKEFAQRFGRTARNYVDAYPEILGFTLVGDSRAADEWETSTGGKYYCTGVGSGLAGVRADLGLIDDYIGKDADADSKVTRDQQWDWFVSDFYPRTSGTKATNKGSIVIIANRRHEDDLVGRLLRTEENDSPVHPDKWEVIKLPFFAEENDPLGRSPGDVIWPEKFTAEIEAIKRMPSRIRAGLYQQSPRPDDGNYFKQTWLAGYERQDLPDPSTLRIYAASDHACTDEGGDSTVCLFGGWDGKNLWILPECYWAKDDTGKVVTSMLRYGKLHNPLVWWAEKGHISKSIGPFLRDRMQEERNYLRIEEITPKHDKPTRARSAQGMCEFGQVLFPKFAPWWDKAENELLTFPGGKSDDWIDAFAHLCAGIFRMTTPTKPKVEVKEEFNQVSGFGFTINSIKKVSMLKDRRAIMLRADR